MSKVGELYKVVGLSPSRYFQLVAIDATQLNSDVIAVFNYQETSEGSANPQAILDSGVEFFTHTTVSAGVKRGLWVKLAQLVPVDCSKALFKDAYFKNGFPDIQPFEADYYPEWVVWGVNQEWRHIGDKLEKYPQAELGLVFNPDTIVKRIANGQYPGVPYYGQVR